MITETRKEIINLISDYMEKDKEWRIWTLIYDESIKLFWIIYKECEYWEPEIIREDWVETYVKLHKPYIKTIIYDITAILKYIVKNWWGIRDDDNWNIDIFRDDVFCIWQLLYKPLHLYTEEEDINLLNLLLKLK